MNQVPHTLKSGLLCKPQVVRNFLNVAVNSWQPRAIDPSKPMQWQDRRLIKPQPEDVGFGKNSTVSPYCTGTEWPLAYYERRGSCWNNSPPLMPPHKVGDVLYVRESFAQVHPCQIGADRYSQDGTAGIPGPPPVKYRVIYKSDGPYNWCHHIQGFPYRARCECDLKDDAEIWHFEKPVWTPSIHMPKEFSRIHLEVMRVRVERACDISEEDALAEGMIDDVNYVAGDHINDPAKYLFRQLWTSLYGPDAWNKWVWVYDLKRVK
jgi:hypothetical protein